MAFQAEDVEIAGLEQTRIGRAMRRVARFAAFRLDHWMFENERPLLVHVACETDGIPRCRGTQLLADEPAVRVMAIRALNKSFLDAMVKGHIELRFHFQVAAVAELGLRFCEKEVTCGGVMRGMAGYATEIILAVGRAGKVGVVLPGSVAIQAALIYLFCGGRLKTEDLRFVATALDMVLARPVASFTPLLRGPSPFIEVCFPVRRGFETL